MNLLVKLLIAFVLVLLILEGISTCAKKMGGIEEPAQPTPEQVAEKKRKTEEFITMSRGIREAIKDCQLDKVKFFIEQGWDPNGKIFTKIGRGANGEPLFYTTDQFSTIGYAIHSFPKIDYRNKSGRKHEPVAEDLFARKEDMQEAQQCLAIVKHLVAGGADPGKTSLGASIVEDAVKTLYTPLLEFLSANGIDFQSDMMNGAGGLDRVNGVVQAGQTPLLMLSSEYPKDCDEERCRKDDHGFNYVFEWLWNQPGRNPNAVTSEGHTALHEILDQADSESIAIARLQRWLEDGTSKCTRDRNNKQPQDIALKEGWAEAFRLVECK